MTLIIKEIGRYKGREGAGAGVVFFDMKKRDNLAYKTFSI